MIEIEKREDQVCNGNHESASVTANSIALATRRPQLKTETQRKS